MMKEVCKPNLWSPTSGIASDAKRTLPFGLGFPGVTLNSANPGVISMALTSADHRQALTAIIESESEPNIDPTSSSAHRVDIVRIFRMVEEPAPAPVATPHEAQKTVLDQTLRSKRQGVNIAPDFTACLALRCF